MQDGMKIGAAALGGYVLGRTKKAKAAIGLALWLGGKRHIGEFARSELVHLAASEHGKEIAGVGRQAVVALVEKQAGRLGDAMQKRAEALEPEQLTKRRPPRRAARDDHEAGYDDGYDEDDQYTDQSDESDESDEDYDDSEEYEDEYDDEAEGDEYDDEAEGDEYEDEYDDEPEDEDQGQRELVGARRRR